MRRGLFSFLVVVGFIPAVLYSASLHARAVERITLDRTRLLEQQALTNMENEFEDTFWAVATRGGSLAAWRKAMGEKGISVWSGKVGPDYYSHAPPETFGDLVELSPDGKSVEVKKGTDPYVAIGASMRAGNATTLFLIPVGCSRGL